MSQTTHIRRKRVRMSADDLEFLDRLIKLGLITEEQFVEITAEFRRRGGPDLCALIVKGGYLRPRRRGWDRSTLRDMVGRLWERASAI